MDIKDQQNNQTEPASSPRPAAPAQSAVRKPGLLRRFRPLILALVLGATLIGGAAYYAYGRESGEVMSGSGTFDPNSVLPAPVSQPEASKAYSLASLKEHDGKDGRTCYVAVKGKVYEIKDSSYWQNGQHTPSNGQGVCGGDMTETIKQSPHGESILERLPQVGVLE